VIGHDFDDFGFFPAALVLAAYVLVPDKQSFFRIALIAVSPQVLVAFQLPDVVSQLVLSAWIQATDRVAQYVFLPLALRAVVVVSLSALVAFLQVPYVEQAFQLRVDAVSQRDFFVAERVEP